MDIQGRCERCFSRIENTAGICFVCLRNKTEEQTP